MKIVYSVGGEYSDCIVKYFDLNDFEKKLKMSFNVDFLGKK